MSRILLVDDEAAARLVLQNRLKDLGHEVVAVENGAKGVLEAREGGFELVLVEAGLGSGVSGIEVCRRIKQIPQSTHTPVVMLSRGSSSKDEMHQAYEAGCDAFLQKADMVLFEDVLRTMLRAKSVHDELLRQIRALEGELRRRQEERQRDADRGVAESGGGEQSLVFRELATGRPDGVLLVDADGIVRHADRGARDLLGVQVEGKSLGRLAPNTGLEAFVRDAHTEPREGFRFDFKVAGGRPGRSLSASVVPLSANPGEKDPGMRVVLLLDSGKRRVASELLRMQEYSIPRREVGVLLDAARRAFGADSLVGNSAAMRGVRARVAELAGGNEPVLITGESGTGKQHLARALHFTGSSSGPFLPLSCAAFSPENLEIELFGQARGAGPGARAEQPGVLQQALHGTVYLAECDHLSRELQDKLLRAVRDGEVVRAGSERPERIDVRIVVSTTQPLERIAAAGSSRELFDLLANRRLHIPPLRERREDVPALCQHFLQRFGALRTDLEISDGALWVLESHDWPGNVRELETAIERACAAAPGGTIALEHLPPALRELHGRLPERSLVPSPRQERVAIGGGAVAHDSSPAGHVLHPQPPAIGGLREPWEIGAEDPISLDLYEKKALLRALHETGGDKLAAARLLKVGKSTLYRKLKRFGIA